MSNGVNESWENLRDELLIKHPVLGEYKPLKRNIHKSIAKLKDGIDKDDLQRVMVWIITRDEYMRSHVSGAKRVDIEGAETAQEVTKIEAKKAAEMLEKVPLQADRIALRLKQPE
jgi:hypothetical protein